MTAGTFVVRGQSVFIRQFVVEVVEGVDRKARAVSTGEELTIGTAEGNELQVKDPSVSRHHCVLRAHARGIELRDLGSTNGTKVGDVEVFRANIVSGARLRLGNTVVTVTALDELVEQPLAAGEGFGELLGASIAMRRMYPVLERYAASDATVLVHGETGTGKELVAEAIHAHSPRKHQPFVIVDCSAMREVAESELFGHVKGAFTGAEAHRAGAFEAADGGTVFLDEIGELPLALQPLLLRVLESRTIRRIGANDVRPVDVRVIAASHRDLRVESNAKRFRADLYYRLAVLQLHVPPLRERDGDIALLARRFWSEVAPDRALPAELLAELAVQPWPGNVRELKHAVERAALVGIEAPPPEALSYGQAKERAIATWEAAWVHRLLAAHDHNLSRGARREDGPHEPARARAASRRERAGRRRLEPL